MRRFLNILSNKLTIGSLLSVMVSFAFAVLLRIVFADLLDISIIKGELDISNISFFSIIALFRFIFAALLEYSFGDKMHHTVGTFFKEFDITLKMEEKNTASSSSSKELSSGGSSKKLSSNSSSKELPSSSSKELPSGEKMELLDHIMDNTELQRKMIMKLHNLKLEKDLQYFEDDEDNLSLSAPLSVNDKDLQKLSKEVSVIDRIIKTKFSEYKKLVKKDVEYNNGT